MVRADTIYHMTDDIVTVDHAGRMVIPIRLRRRLQIHAGARLRIKETGNQLVLEPVSEASQVEERQGLYVVRGKISVRDADHRIAREERIDRLTPRS
jgi:AbrB family looped-hinge helix DNA binding protein